MYEMHSFTGRFSPLYGVKRVTLYQTPMDLPECRVFRLFDRYVDGYLLDLHRAGVGQ